MWSGRGGRAPWLCEVAATARRESSELAEGEENCAALGALWAVKTRGKGKDSLSYPHQPAVGAAQLKIGQSLRACPVPAPDTIKASDPQLTNLQTALARSALAPDSRHLTPARTIQEDEKKSKRQLARQEVPRSVLHKEPPHCEC